MNARSILEFFEGDALQAVHMSAAHLATNAASIGLVLEGKEQSSVRFKIPQPSTAPQGRLILAQDGARSAESWVGLILMIQSR